MKGRSFEGFETLLNAFYMTLKMHLFALLIAVIAHAFILIYVTDLTSVKTQFFLSWHKIKVFAAAPINLTTHIYVGDEIYEGTAKALVQVEKIKYIADVVNDEYLPKLLFSCIIYGLYPAVLYFFKKRSNVQVEKEYIRGARLLPKKEFKKNLRKQKETLDLPLGSFKMPKNLENRQTLFIGKPGSGKTQALLPILRKLIERKEQGICYDNKGDYFPVLYNPQKDILFNPLDQRSVGWNLFNELVSYPDIDAVAASLIPPSKAKTDPFWNDAARGVFSGILHYLYQNNLRKNYDLWKLLTADAQEIAAKLKNTRGGEAGYRYITQNAENSKQAESVLAVMMQYTKCFEYMYKNDGGLTINNWLENGEGFIYITNYDVIEETLRPILSLFIDLVSRKLLSMPDSDIRRIYFHVDEFGSLQRLPSLINLLTKGRSKGACSFLGIQDDGQMEQIYTEQLRKAIDNAFGNRTTFSLSGQTAELESKYHIGQTEFYETSRSMSMGPNSMRDGVSLQKTKKISPLFLPSDISNLKDLNAIVRLKNYDFVLSKWKYKPSKIVHEPFMLREDLKLEKILNEINKIKKIESAKVSGMLNEIDFDQLNN